MRGKSVSRTAGPVDSVQQYAVFTKLMGLEAKLKLCGRLVVSRKRVSGRPVANVVLASVVHVQTVPDRSDAALSGPRSSSVFQTLCPFDQLASELFSSEVTRTSVATLRSRIYTAHFT